MNEFARGMGEGLSSFQKRMVHADSMGGGGGDACCVQMIVSAG